MVPQHLHSHSSPNMNALRHGGVKGLPSMARKRWLAPPIVRRGLEFAYLPRRRDSISAGVLKRFGSEAECLAAEPSTATDTSGVPANSLKPAIFDLHKSIGLVSFSAYFLGATSTLLGLPENVWLPVLTGGAIGGLFASLDRFCVVRLWRSPARPLNIVVSGGSKGLGKALAREFLREGDKVFVTARSEQGIQQAIRELRSEVDCDLHNISGYPCDVSDPTSVAQMIAAAQEQLGTIDVWVNNAGYSGSFQTFLDSTPEQLSQVVSTNLLGTMLCTRGAIKAMSKQELGGHVFNMDGAGADGMATPQYAAYGATKCGLVQLSRSLGEELSSSNVGIHTLSPGMMLTELLLENATPQNKQVFNILCEQPETVAAFLVPRVRSVVARGDTGQYIRYLTGWSALGRFLTAPARIGRFFDAEGEAVYPPEAERIKGGKARVTQRLADRASRRSSGLGLAYSLSIAVSVMVLMADAAVWAK